MSIVFVIAFGIGIIAGLRSMTAPAVVSWAARLGWIHVGGTPFAFLGYSLTPWILTLLACGELVADKLPKTPSRRAPGPFAVRVVTGGFSGAAVCAGSGESWMVGALLGGVGAAVGTLGGYEARTGTVRALHVPDLAVALVEDAIAVGGAFLMLSQL